MASVEIVEHDPAWTDAFDEIAARLRDALGERATRIDHIGSTAVPGLAAKDVIDVQVTVKNDADLERAARALAGSRWVRSDIIHGDHDVPGLPPNQGKAFLSEPPGSRRANVHVRVAGRPNQRYPLLVRDYLRTHPTTAQAYEMLKRNLAQMFPNDSGRYADTKDAACDLVYLAAQEWAQTTGWDAGPPDA